MNTNIVICGNYGATNLGDEAILESILQTVKNALPQGHIQVLSSRPEATSKQHHVEAFAMVPAGVRSFFRGVFRGTLFKTLRVYKKADLVIFGGGGLFTDEKPQAVIIWFLQIFPALWHKKKVICYGQSIGPLKRKWARKIVRNVFDRILANNGKKLNRPVNIIDPESGIVVRDQKSAEFLIEGEHNRGPLVLPDPVFGLKLDSSKNPPAIKKSAKPYIIISLREWINTPPNFTQTIAEFIDWVHLQYGFLTLLVPFQHDHGDDSIILKSVTSHLQNIESAQVLPFDEDYLKVIALMQNAKIVVGMRLHSLIFSTLAHTPFLALSYSQKVSEVVAQLGMSEFEVECKSLSTEDLKEKFASLIKKRDEVSKMLAAKHKISAKETERYQELLVCSR